MATTFASFGFTVLTKHSVWRNLLPIKRTKLVYIPATSRTRPLNPVDDSRHINSAMNTKATHLTMLMNLQITPPNQKTNLKLRASI